MARYIRVRSYLDQKFTGCEHLYSGDNQVKALEMFRKEYPEHDQCILIAENYNSDDHPDHFKACQACDCVHFCC